MQTLHLAKALLPDGWHADVRLVVGPNGDIEGVTPDVPPAGAYRVPGCTLPGVVNLHSHSFQRAMAGLAECRASDGSDFWQWREVMYRFLATIGPDELWAITAQLYLELLKGGYTGVCEFHYLHNAPDGRAYDDPATTSLVIHEVASAVGIGLTLLPSLYVHGGFGEQPLENGQRRFAITPDRYLELLARLDAALEDHPERRLGMAPHSLRAVAPDQLAETVELRRQRDPCAPIHLHLAEQEREVNECLARSRQRPGELLFDRLPVDHRWCLIHGTHLDTAELDRVSAAGAVIGLCPTTEANLGDGIFPLEHHLAGGGRIGVGSDSNVCRTWTEELRLLEYGQRLSLRRRAIAASPQQPSTGAALFGRALHGGAQASGRLVGRLAPGARADLVVLDSGDPALLGRTDDQLLDSLIFATDRPPVNDVMVGGVWRIRDGHHAAEGSIVHAFRRTMRQLLA